MDVNTTAVARFNVDCIYPAIVPFERIGTQMRCGDAESSLTRARSSYHAERQLPTRTTDEPRGDVKEA